MLPPISYQSGLSCRFQRTDRAAYARTLHILSHPDRALDDATAGWEASNVWPVATWQMQYSC
jgi:hypothetical protein